jgi:ABC-type uncharacterized transport system permease subunit
MMLSVATMSAAIAGYAGATWIEIRMLKTRSTSPTAWLWVLIAIALLGHAVNLAHLIFHAGTVDFELLKAASAISWVITAFISSVRVRRKPVASLLVLTFPLAIVALVLSNLITGLRTNGLVLEPAITVHILTSLFAYSVLSLAAVQAISISVQERALKQHRLRGYAQFLPPLQMMEEMLFELLWLGVGLLTVAIGTGFLFLHDMLGQHVAHKTVFSICAWLIFSTLLWGRYARGWRGRTAVRFTLVGFVLMMLAYFGSKFVLEIILQK